MKRAGSLASWAIAFAQTAARRPVPGSSRSSVASDAVKITGSVITHTLRHEDGREAVRNACAVCGGLVYGGEVGNPEGHTIYAGSLDDPSLFKPSMAIFARDKPDWVVVPPGLALFESLPS
jgi:hypothetical protein